MLSKESCLSPGKKIIVEIKGEKYARHLIKTHFIETSDKLEKIIEKYVLLPANNLAEQTAKKDLIIILAQKIISILQNRIIYKKDVNVGFWARFLAKFVKKTPYGFSVGNPLKMQVAINLAGLPRILFACFCSGVCKIFRVYGIFYRVAGNQISEIDGFYGEAFPQYAEIGILGPKDCDVLCQELKNRYNFSFAVADINDLGGNILGKSKDLENKEKLLLEILKDNPAGQGNNQTPIIIINKL
ncbi:MAG: F420-0--gamma-glutamyl ligase [Candidatus Pacebacteria bacterium]|nr:F420-0--gamma-glutamyl ligase [Candidatus Paceibacterota bacterium]